MSREVFAMHSNLTRWIEDADARQILLDAKAHHRHDFRIGLFAAVRRAYVLAMIDDLRAVFAGPNARQRAIDYARHRFAEFHEIELEPYR